MQVYNKETLSKALNIAETSASNLISKIRRKLKEDGKTLATPSGTVTDTMLYLYDETCVPLEMFAMLKQAEEIALLRELIEQKKPLAGTSDFED